jgi:sugar-specific transcriptional regulator TrmB
MTSGTENMAFTPGRTDIALDELESKYGEITTLYDLASELVETVESDFVNTPEMQWSIVEPLINEIGDATDILTEEFLHVAEGVRRGAPGKASKSRIEGAMRRMYAAINDYRDRVKNVTKQAYNALENIADPIVNKIQRQIERVIVIFIEFIQLSLASIMNQNELSQLKAREARVALMMHQVAQQQ